MSKLTASNQNLPETTDDQERGKRELPSKPGAAVPPSEPDDDTVRKAPEGPSDGQGTDDEEEVKQRTQ